MRRWRGPFVRRGKIFYVAQPFPAVPAVPSFMDPSGPRPIRFPTRAITSNRRFNNPPWPQANQGGFWPSYIRQPRTHYVRGVKLLPSGRRRFDPGFGQGNRGTPYPVFTRQQGITYKRGIRLLPSATRRRFDPGWGQANQGQPWPSYIRQPRTADKRGIKFVVARGRRYDPAWPQANQGKATPSFTRQAGIRKIPVRRGSFQVVLSAKVQLPPPQFLRTSFDVHALRAPRGRILPPPLPQGVLSQAYPVFTRQPKNHYSRGVKIPRGKFGQFNLPQANQGSAYPVFTRQHGAEYSRGIKFIVARGRRFDPLWPQANQGEAYPTFTRQSKNSYSRGIKLVVSRGRRYDPAWPQGPLTHSFPVFTRQQGYKKYPSRKGSFQAVVPPFILRAVPSFIRGTAIKRGIKIPRAKYWQYPITQGTLGKNYPTYVRQPKTPYSRGIKVVRGHRYDFPFGQGNQGTLWSQYRRQPGITHRRGIKIPRGNIYRFAIPQGNQGTHYASYIKQSKNRTARLPVSKRSFYSVFSGIIPTYPVFTRSTLRTRLVRMPRGKIFFVSQNQIAPIFLPYMRQAWRPKIYQKRGKIFFGMALGPPIPPIYLNTKIKNYGTRARPYDNPFGGMIYDQDLDSSWSTYGIRGGLYT